MQNINTFKLQDWLIYLFITNRIFSFKKKMLHSFGFDKLQFSYLPKEKRNTETGKNDCGTNYNNRDSLDLFPTFS